MRVHILIFIKIQLCPFFENYVIFTVIQKAGTHMEYTFLASYIVMVFGYLVMNNEEFLEIVRKFLKGHNFSAMVDTLKKFFNFMNLTASVGNIKKEYLSWKDHHFYISRPVPLVYVQ